MRLRSTSFPQATGLKASSPSHAGTAPAEAPLRSSPAEDLGTGLTAAWALTGLYIDAFWHVNWPETLESFFTPWHGILYSGAAAMSAWIMWMVARRRRVGGSLRASVPIGYGYAVVGLVVFWCGAMADSVWHGVLHVDLETGIETLVSPPHLALIFGGLLMTSSPFRSAWSRPLEPAPNLPRFAPQLLSLVVVVALVKLLALPLAALHLWAAVTPVALVSTPVYRFYNVGRLIGVANILLATVVLFTPVLLLLRRWRPPFGVCAILFTIPALAEQAIYRFALWPIAFGALAGGLVTDGLIRWLLPSAPHDPDRLRLLSVLAPIGLWSACFAALAAVFPLVWSPILVSGSILLSGLLGLGLCLLVAPPALPSDRVIDLRDR